MWSAIWLQLTWQEQILALLTVGILAVLTISLMLGVSTLTLHRANLKKGRFWSELEAKWDPVLAQVLQGLRKPESLWELVFPDEALYFVDYLLRQAEKGGEVEKLRQAASPFLKYLRRHFRAGSPEQKARAVQTLRLLGQADDYLEELIGLLSDPAPLAAIQAARLLARDRRIVQAPLVLQQLPRFENWSLDFLSNLLADFGPGLIPDLRRVFADGESPPRLRLIAGRTLIKLRDSQAAAKAAGLLHDAASQDQRDLLICSLQILGQLGGEAYLPEVLALLHHQDFAVRAHAIRILAQLTPRPDPALLRQAFDDPSPWVAIQAAQALKQSGQGDFLQGIGHSAHPRAQLARQVLTGGPA